jgi:hypothetical protein
VTKNHDTKATHFAHRKKTASGVHGWQKPFIEALRQMPNVTVACESARVSRPMVYRTRERSKRFADQWDRACIAGRERLEAYLWRRATVGIKRGVWMKDKDGNPVKVEDIHEVSDGVGLALLKAHWPEKYREVGKVEVSGPDGGPMVTATASVVTIVWPHETAIKSNGNGNGNGQKTIEVNAEPKQLNDGNPA